VRDYQAVWAGRSEQTGLGCDGEEGGRCGGYAVGGPWVEELELLGALGALAQCAES